MVSQTNLFVRSSSGALVGIAMLSNLVAFIASTSLPAAYSELDQMVQPGSLLSLARTEGIVLLASIIFFAVAPRGFGRVALQSFVSGFVAADAVNDVVLRATGSDLLATYFSWFVAVGIPVVAFLSVLNERMWRAAAEGSA